MPTYVYEREDGSRFEEIESMKADPLTTCPATGQPVHRVPQSGGGVRFMGTGWPGIEANKDYVKVHVDDNGKWHPRR